ncbi:MAG: 3' terminal RNA ribose 2'-O-methyltransferase Hen1 [Pirellulales bacterium]
MLLTITLEHRPGSDLGYLLHKHPARHQVFDLASGQAHVFYPEVTDDRATAALLLEMDSVGLVRRGGGEAEALLDSYVNDRPYVASSFLSVALSRVFSSAMSGKAKDRPELAERELPLTARIDVIALRGGGESLARRIFEPLGYAVECLRHPLDEQFPQWGEGPYYSLTLRAVTRLAALLNHLYVLIPVFDNAKHYYVGDDELQKLLEHGAGWLERHPERETIARRYLKNRRHLFEPALDRLAAAGDDCTGDDFTGEDGAGAEEGRAEDAGKANAADEGAAATSSEEKTSLHDQRLDTVLEQLLATGATSVLDLGCGEGKLLRRLMRQKQFERIVGMDVSLRSLEIAKGRLRLEQLPPKQAARLELLHGSLIYRDARLEGFEAAALVEVIEHLDMPRLAALERVVFECARPRTVVLTTPNREYNVRWESLPAGQVRHSDHRFEWTRAEFQAWADRVARQYGYSVRYSPVGPEDAEVGAPSQMGVFERRDAAGASESRGDAE